MGLGRSKMSQASLFESKAPKPHIIYMAKTEVKGLLRSQLFKKSKSITLILSLYLFSQPCYRLLKLKSMSTTRSIIQ
jgi:hypothetical protein